MQCCPSSATRRRSTSASPRTGPTSQITTATRMKLLLLWLINAVALMAVAYLLPGIAVSSFVVALIAALVLGLINALLFWLVGSFIEGFVVSGFWWGVFGAIAYSIVSWALSALLLK